MKKCPKCQMTIDAHSECPVCKQHLCDVEYVINCKGERYKLNKYFLPYFLKKCVFALICTAIVLAKIILFGIRFNLYF